MENNNETKSPLASEIPADIPQNEQPQPIEKELPAQVKVNMELDKKNNIHSTNITPDLMKPVNPIAENSINFGKKFLKISLIIFGVVMFGALILLIFTLTNVDTKFIKITLSGKITDQVNGNPIENALLYINDKQVAGSAKDGTYQILGLDAGKVTLTIKADGYDDLTDEVAITRLLLDYNTRKDYQMTSSQRGSLSGKFIANSQSYQFTDDNLYLDNQVYKINSDGSFLIDNLKIGNFQLKFQSNSFKDFSQNITLVAGTNKIDQITLSPAGDIIGDLKSYVKEDLVLGTKFYVENILQDQVNITDTGSFTIEDLDINKNYKIRVTAEGYNSKDYQVDVKQGLNQIPNFKLVENGNAFYFARLEGFSSYQFVSSDLDGSNVNNLSQSLGKTIFGDYYNSSENVLYFLSSTTSNSINQVYTYNLTTKAIQNLVTTPNIVYANYIAKKVATVTYKNGGTQFPAKLNIQGFSSESSTLIKQINSGDFNKALISDSGKVVTYVVEENTNDNNRNTKLYYYSTDNSLESLVSDAKNILLYDISSDGNLVLFARLNTDTGLNDLVLYNKQTNETRVLQENYDGTLYRFLKSDNNKIIYKATRTSKSNIYTYTIDQSKDERLTNLTLDYEVQYIFQESGYIFYATNKGLYILDFNKPKNFKLVAESIGDYTHYELY